MIFRCPSRNAPYPSLAALLLLCIGCGDTTGQAILPPVGQKGGSLETDMSRVPVLFDQNGWISKSTNDLDIQGSWYVIWGQGSAISGEYTDNTVHVTGTAAPDPSGQDFASYFGAKIGFYLCTDETTQGDDDAAAYAASECPFNDTLAEQLVGVTFTLEGMLPTTELRLQLGETGRTDGTYKVVSGEGAQTVWFSETKLLYDANAEPFHKERFNAVFFFVASTGGPTDFDFYIKDLAIWAYL